MKNVIVISGKQGSGKSTLSNNLKALLAPRHVYQYRFAQPLYDIQEAVFGVCEKYGLPVPENRKDGRLLQLLGTEWGRQVHGTNVWVECLIRRIAMTEAQDRCENVTPGIFIIDDCRFENELHAFRSAFKVRLECDRDTRQGRAQSWRPTEDHPSETGLDGHDGDFDLIIDTHRLGTAQVAELVKREFFRHVGELTL